MFFAGFTPLCSILSTVLKYEGEEWPPLSALLLAASNTIH